MKRRTIKEADSKRDPLVVTLFEEMNRREVSAKDLEEMTLGSVHEDTILQWRTRSVPTIKSLRACLEALGFRIYVEEV